MDKIAIISYLRDEAHILNEWILHHLRYGIDHFYLVDNGSKDSLNKIINRHKRHITLIDGSNLKQFQAYKLAYKSAKEHYDWVAFLDLDEFLYIEVEGQNIPGFLTELDKDIQSIRIFWRLFLPTQFLQPKSIIQESTLTCTQDKVSTMPYKSVSRTDLGMRAIGIHAPKIDDRHTLSHSPSDKLLQINHYRFQSYEYTLGIKSDRGGGVHKGKYTAKSSCRLLKRYFKSTLHQDDHLKKSSAELIHTILSNEQIPPQVEIYNAECWSRLRGNKVLERIASDNSGSAKMPKKLYAEIVRTLDSMGLTRD